MDINHMMIVAVIAGAVGVGYVATNMTPEGVCEITVTKGPIDLIEGLERAQSYGCKEVTVFDRENPSSQTKVTYPIPTKEAVAALRTLHSFAKGLVKE